MKRLKIADIGEQLEKKEKQLNKYKLGFLFWIMIILCLDKNKDQSQKWEIS